MFGAISADIIMDLAKADGYYYQPPLFLTPAKFELDPQYMCSVYSGFKAVDDGTGKSTSVTSTTDHPAFAELRNQLERRGYIKTERSWINGDRVLNPFYLNDYLFERGDKFLSACAIKNTIEFSKVSKFTDKKPSPYIPVRTHDINQKGS